MTDKSSYAATITRIKIFGERNTGTNYLLKLIEENFNLKIIPGNLPPKVNKWLYHLPKTERIKDWYFSVFFGKYLGWKHAEVNTEVLKKTAGNQSEHILFIAITKNPYAWLLSMYNRPHHGPGKQNLDFSTFLKSSWTTLGRESQKAYYANPIELWNHKNYSYTQLNKDLNTLLVKYEDLVLNPSEVLRRISQQASSALKHKEIVNYTESTKEEGKSYDYYKDYYGNEKWQNELKPEHIQIINKHLDKEVMRMWDYKLLNEQ